MSLGTQKESCPTETWQMLSTEGERLHREQVTSLAINVGILTPVTTLMINDGNQKSGDCTDDKCWHQKAGDFTDDKRLHGTEKRVASLMIKCWHGEAGGITDDKSLHHKAGGFADDKHLHHKAGGLTDDGCWHYETNGN